MVPDSSLPDVSLPDPSSWSRRRFLAALCGLGAGGTVAVGATAPTALPDALTDEATKHYPTPPEVAAHWEPTVTEAHARSVIERLADVAASAEALWPEVETDRHNTGAGGWLETAREELEDGNYNDALFDATYGLQFAAEELGFARARLDQTDVPALADRTLAVRDRIAAVRDALDPYNVDDPGVDLAWYHRIETETLRAENHAGWGDAAAAANGVDDDDGPPAGDLDAHAVGSLTADVHLAEVCASNAERYSQHLQDRLGDDPTPYAAHLERVADAFRTTLADRPSRDDVRARYGLDDADEHGPYEFAHAHLARSCFDAAIPVPWETDVDASMHATTTLALATAIVDWRAHDFAVDHLVVDQSTTGFDSGHVLAEKRRARSTYQDALGDSPPPFLAQQAGRAIEDLQVAKVGFADSYRDPIWKERLNAYLYALLGRAKLHHHPRLYQRIVDGP
ncbi:hypothetical protein G9C85_03175 [Halorubellus sp. JP-L1]|uniref:hypothetical protein n=1 Tax=Halorubellus sp. JP-L1 TaxID=2715753 RepID=UPI0014087316|nr:hypothetical protein [Halorubellus sp. JP-L1]NHN40639.1 hypothetical protein [Halorubellus sp. JP-L1]